MSRSKRLDPLMRIAQKRKDDVAKELVNREKALAEQQHRFNVLKQYADGFSLGEAGTVLAPSMLANHVAFRMKLDTALLQQEKVVDASHRQRDTERGRLISASRENKVLEQLAATYRAEEVRVANQREQRELDDLGGRRVRSLQEEKEP